MDAIISHIEPTKPWSVTVTALITPTTTYEVPMIAHTQYVEAYLEA